jgi:hypothetical protein
MFEDILMKGYMPNLESLFPETASERDLEVAAGK